MIHIPASGLFSTFNSGVVDCTTIVLAVVVGAAVLAFAVRSSSLSDDEDDGELRRSPPNDISIAKRQV